MDREELRKALYVGKRLAAAFDPDAVDQSNPFTGLVDR